MCTHTSRDFKHNKIWINSDKIKTSCCIFVVLFSSSYIRLYTWHIYHIGINNHNPTGRYPYFDAVVGLVWSDDPESCAGSSDANGMTSRARRVKGDDPDKKGYPGPPGWGLGVRCKISPRKTYICWETSVNFYLTSDTSKIGSILQRDISPLELQITPPICSSWDHLCLTPKLCSYIILVF